MNANARSRFRVAVVGCGAVTRASLLPVLAGHDQFEVVALIDRDLERATQLAHDYGISLVAQDVEAIATTQADGIVLATPPAHHAPATVELAGRGFHVFVEKPMALNAPEAEQMIRACDAAGVTLAVGLYRRLLPSARLLRGMVDAEMLGRPLRIDAEEVGGAQVARATCDWSPRAG